MILSAPLRSKSRTRCPRENLEKILSSVMINKSPIAHENTEMTKEIFGISLSTQDLLMGAEDLHQRA